jgi:ribosome-binding protein aMBF1 (putative translation factor)
LYFIGTIKHKPIMSHQDWTHVVFNKKSNSENEKGNPTTTSSSSSSLSNVGVYKAASDDDVKKTKYVLKTTSQAIMSARAEKKMTQKELAQKCNMDVSIINEIERGTCVYNATHVNKIQSVLGVKIPRV